MTAIATMMTACERAHQELLAEERRRYDRLRSRAKTLGLRLVKSRRDGTYGLIDAWTNGVFVAWDTNGYGLDLDAVEEYLTVDPDCLP